MQGESRKEGSGRRGLKVRLDGYCWRYANTSNVTNRPPPSRFARRSWIMVEWDPPHDNTLGCPEEYELQVCNKNAGVDDVWETCAVVNCTGGKFGEPNPEDCNAFVTNLKSCVNYIFRVRSCTARGWSVWGDISDEITTLGRF